MAALDELIEIVKGWEGTKEEKYVKELIDLICSYILQFRDMICNK
jgi:hypothetical protein